MLPLCLGKKLEELFIWISRGSFDPGTHLLHFSSRKLYRLLGLQLCKANLTIEAIFLCELPSLVLLHFGFVEVCCLPIRAHKHGKCSTFAAGAAADRLGDLDSLTPCIGKPGHTVEADFNLGLSHENSWTVYLTDVCEMRQTAITCKNVRDVSIESIEFVSLTYSAFVCMLLPCKWQCQTRPMTLVAVRHSAGSTAPCCSFTGYPALCSTGTSSATASAASLARWKSRSLLPDCSFIVASNAVLSEAFPILATVGFAAWALTLAFDTFEALPFTAFDFMATGIFVGFPMALASRKVFQLYIYHFESPS